MLEDTVKKRKRQPAEWRNYLQVIRLICSQYPEYIKTKQITQFQNGQGI